MRWVSRVNYLLEASLVVNTKLLSLLATADVLGRKCADAGELLERISFFEAYCIEQDCYGKPYLFVSDKARFNYFYKDDALPDYTPFDAPICEAILLSGLPGMGKDHYISQHCKNLPVISLDAIRRQYKLKPEDKSASGWVSQQAKEQARVHLRAKQDFVWNATNITRQMRGQLIDLFASYGAKVKIVYIEKSWKVWQAQNLQCEHSVPASVLAQLLRKLEVPTRAEAHAVTYIVDG